MTSLPAKLTRTLTVAVLAWALWPAVASADDKKPTPPPSKSEAQAEKKAPPAPAPPAVRESPYAAAARAARQRKAAADTITTEELERRFGRGEPVAAEAVAETPAEEAAMTEPADSGTVAPADTEAPAEAAASEAAAGDTPAIEPATTTTTAPAAEKTTEVPPGEGDPVEYLRNLQATEALRRTELAAAQAEVEAARLEVANQERLLLAVSNPFAARPEMSDEERKASRGETASERQARTRLQLAEAQQRLAAAEARLAQAAR